MSGYSIALANVIQEQLDEMGLNYTWDEEHGIARFRIGRSGRLSSASCVMHVQSTCFTTYAICPVSADHRDRKQMMDLTEFLSRANYNLIHGSFELDYRDGEIRFKDTIDCFSITPSPNMIHDSIHCPMAMLERYGDGIVSVIYGICTPEEAVRKCEEKKINRLGTLLGRMKATPEEFLEGFTAFLSEQMRKYGEENGEENSSLTSTRQPNQEPEN